MGQITATNGSITRTFRCGQVALLGGVPAGWTITENTCGIYLTSLRSPFASFGLELSGAALPGKWYTYKGTVASNEIEIPPEFITLPSIPDNVQVVVRRQQYHPDVPGDTRDFLVNTTDNKIEFHVSGLDGQVAYVRIFK